MACAISLAFARTTNPFFPSSTVSVAAPIAAVIVACPAARAVTLPSLTVRTVSSLLLNVTKELAGIDHSVQLIPQEMIEPIQRMKVSLLHGNNPRLHTDEILVALSMLSLHDENCRKALATLPQLKGCQVHSTTMLNEVDRKIFKKLGIGLTCEPVRKK